MKNHIETARTDYVCTLLKEHSGSTGIIDHRISDIEDYKISDAWITSTANTEYPLENKTITGGWKFKEDGQWRCYFTGGCSRSIFSKFRSDCTIATGSPVYILNAETEGHDFEGCKWDKMMKDPKSCLSILAADGVVLFSHKTLVDAFLGYAYMWVKHTTEFGKTENYHWELKSVFDLSKGLFISGSTPSILL